MVSAIFLPIVIDGEVSAKRTEGSSASTGLMTPPSAYDAYAFWPLRGQNRSPSPASLGKK
jgi:hypothetical protein